MLTPTTPALDPAEAVRRLRAEARIFENTVKLLLAPTLERHTLLAQFAVVRENAIAAIRAAAANGEGT